MHEIDIFGELNKYIEKAVLIINALILFITITKTSQKQKDILSCHHSNQISKLSLYGLTHHTWGSRSISQILLFWLFWFLFSRLQFTFSEQNDTIIFFMNSPTFQLLLKKGLKPRKNETHFFYQSSRLSADERTKGKFQHFRQLKLIENLFCEEFILKIVGQKFPGHFTFLYSTIFLSIFVHLLTLPEKSIEYSFSKSSYAELSDMTTQVISNKKTKNKENCWKTWQI